MKKSESLRIESQMEESDSKAFAILAKSEREGRLEAFKEKIWDDVCKKFKTNFDERSEKLTIFGTQFGVIDFFPKANKVLIRRGNKWIYPGLQFIKKLP